MPLARRDGLGAGYARSVTGRRAAAAGLIRVGMAALATGWWAGPLAAAAAGAAMLVAHFAWRAIGGITGDVLGAVEQLAECAVLVVVSGLAARHAVWWMDVQDASSAKRRMPSSRSSSPRAKEKRA